MTAALMKHFAVEAVFSGDTVHMKPARYVAKPYRVEGDWSKKHICPHRLAKEASIYLPGMTSESLQGDRAIVDIMASTSWAHSTATECGSGRARRVNHQSSGTLPIARTWPRPFSRYAPQRVSGEPSVAWRVSTSRKPTGWRHCVVNLARSTQGSRNQGRAFGNWFLAHSM